MFRRNTTCKINARVKERHPILVSKPPFVHVQCGELHVVYVITITKKTMKDSLCKTSRTEFCSSEK